MAKRRFDGHLSGAAHQRRSGGNISRAGLPARRSRQGLLRPRRRSGRRYADRSQAAGQSVDADLLPIRRSKTPRSTPRSGTASSSTWKKSPAKRWCSSRCSRTPPRSKRCAPAVCISPASTPAPIRIAVNCAGFVPFAIMAGKDGTFGYEMEIIVPADSAIKTPADIKGKKLAFTAPTSNSGFKAPSALLEVRIPS